MSDDLLKAFIRYLLAKDQFTTAAMVRANIEAALHVRSHPASADDKIELDHALLNEADAGNTLNRFRKELQDML